jgi:hypothetical protein
MGAAHSRRSQAVVLHVEHARVHDRLHFRGTWSASDCL